MSFSFFNCLKNSKFEGQNVDIFNFADLGSRHTINTETIKNFDGQTYNLRFFSFNYDNINALDRLALVEYKSAFTQNGYDFSNVSYRIGLGSNKYLYYASPVNSSNNYIAHLFGITSTNRLYTSYNDIYNSLYYNTTDNIKIYSWTYSQQQTISTIMCSTTFQFEDWIGFCDITKLANKTVLGVMFNKSDIENMGYNIDLIKHDDKYGDMSSSGGYGGGSFDNTSDAIGVPQLPSIGATTTGFINVYNPSLNELQGFADDLFPDFEIREFSDKTGIDGVVENVKVLGETMHDILESFINSNLINYVIDCHIVPAIPQVGDKVPIKVGFKSFNQSSAKVTSDYVTVDCGTLNIAEYYQNFIDYIGTTAQLYLPFVGFVSIEPEYFQNGSLHVVYSYNVIDGSFMAFILSTSSKSNLKETIIGSYGGNCCVHIPITGLNYSSMISGVVQGVGSMTSSIASANPIGVVSSAMSIASAKPDLENSNAYNANSAFMGVRIPYLLIKRQVSSFSANYTKENALPLNVAKKLDSVKGLTFCDNIILDGINATEEEKEKIKELFKGGVIM